MHKQFMLTALEQACLGRGMCAPNPSVGAVLVKNNQIIAKASHSGFGKAHAEQEILSKIHHGLQDLILYVTLEPCNHWGNTPPCTDLIVAHAISLVVFGFYDPNPIVVHNNTTAILGKHGIKTMYFPLSEIDEFYKSYRHWVQNKRPWITAKIAQSLDGKIACIGESYQLSNVKCGEFTHQQRLRTDVILTTAKTIVVDNPRLDARITGVCNKKNIAILDRRQQLTGSEKIFNHAKQLYVFYSKLAASPSAVSHLGVVHIVNECAGKLDLVAIINYLATMGYHDVWVEAGGELFSALHALHLVNTTYIYLTAKLLGHKAPGAYHGHDFFQNEYKIKWHAMADNMIMQIDWS